MRLLAFHTAPRHVDLGSPPGVVASRGALWPRALAMDPSPRRHVRVAPRGGAHVVDLRAPHRAVRIAALRPRGMIERSIEYAAR